MGRLSSRRERIMLLSALVTSGIPFVSCLGDRCLGSYVPPGDDSAAFGAADDADGRICVVSCVDGRPIEDAGVAEADAPEGGDSRE